MAAVGGRVGPRNRQRLIFAGAGSSVTRSRPRQRAEVLGREALGAHVGRVARARRAPRGRGRGRRPPASASERGSALRRWANAALHEARARAARRGRAGAAQHDEHRVDVRHRVEDGARDARRSTRTSQASWASTDGQPVGRRARASRRSARRPPSGPSRPSASRRRQLLDRAQDRRRGDAVGQVGDDLGRRRVERRAGRAPSRRRGAAWCSASGSSASRSAGSRRRSSSTTCTWRARAAQVLGEHAEPAADLQHDVVGLELGGALDHPEDVASR